MPAAAGLHGPGFPSWPAPPPGLTSLAMSERLSPEVVAHVAQLARLDLTDDELALYTGQLAAVLEHAADVEALELDDVPPTLHPLSIVNVLRADELHACLDRDEVLAMAPSTEDGRFRVPRIMSEPDAAPGRPAAGLAGKPERPEGET